MVNRSLSKGEELPEAVIPKSTKIDKLISEAILEGMLVLHSAFLEARQWDVLNM